MLFLLLIPLWGPVCLLLPSLQTYARFTGAPLKVHKITNPWQSPSGTLCSRGGEGSRAGDGQEYAARSYGQAAEGLVGLLSSQCQELCPPFGPVMERSSRYHTRSSPTFEKR